MQVCLSEHHNMVFRQTLVERDRSGNPCITGINQLWATAHSDQGRSSGYHLTSVAATCPQPSSQTCGLPYWSHHTWIGQHRRPATQQSQVGSKYHHWECPPSLAGRIVAVWCPGSTLQIHPQGRTWPGTWKAEGFPSAHPGQSPRSTKGLCTLKNIDFRGRGVAVGWGEDTGKSSIWIIPKSWVTILVIQKRDILLSSGTQAHIHNCLLLGISP